MNDECASAAREIALFMRRLYRRGLTTASGGNLSVRLDDVVLMTPGGTDKAAMRAGDVGRVTLDGEVLDRDFRPTCEMAMHLAVYRVRPEVRAVVHAHPVTASAFAASDCRISSRLFAETWAVVGEIDTVPYRRQGTAALAEAVAVAAAECNVLLMANHGAMTLGTTLLEAYDRLEVLENAARGTLICEHLLKGRVHYLDERQLRDLTGK